MLGFQRVPALSESVATDITLEVNDGNLTTTTSQKVLIPSSNQMKLYGLGDNLVASVSNNTTTNGILIR